MAHSTPIKKRDETITSGYELQGILIVMRLIYFDEAGTGDEEVEPCVVVAGVMVDGDRQWRAVESHLSSLVAKYVLADDKEGFVFHAKDIHHGTKRIHRDQYSRELRIEMLRELCMIPSRFELPVIAGYVDRREYKKHHPKLSKAERLVNAQVIAAVSCTAGIEKALRADGSSDEVAILVYENNDMTKRTIRECHNYLKLPNAAVDAAASGWALESILPFTRIVDTAHFVEKTEAPILQVADAVAFAISRQVHGRDAERYAEPIGMNLIMRLRAFTPGPGAETAGSA